MSSAKHGGQTVDENLERVFKYSRNVVVTGGIVDMGCVDSSHCDIFMGSCYAKIKLIHVIKH